MAELRDSIKERPVLHPLIVMMAVMGIRRFWPTGVVFILIYPVCVFPLGFLFTSNARRQRGETLELTLDGFLATYALTLLVTIFWYAVFYGIKRILERWRDGQPR